MSATPPHDPVLHPRRIPADRVLRGAGRGAAIGLLLAVVGGASVAYADEPVGWESAPGVSGLQFFLILLLIPLGLALVISLLVAIPSWVRGTSYQSGELWAGDDEWFGGPKDGLEGSATAEQLEAAGDQGGAGARY